MIRSLILALIAAVLITAVSRPRPLEEQLLHLQLEQAVPAYAETLADEPAELQALMLLFASDPILVAKARLALLRYPDLARPILLTHGENVVFQRVLSLYGEDIVLPIHHFSTHDVLTLELMRGLNEGAQSIIDALRKLWAEDAIRAPSQTGALSPEERGRYAIYFLDAEGYDFLGQFMLSKDGTVIWLQTERVLEGFNRFFAGGLKGLETRWRRDSTVNAGDIGWAALDVAVGVGAWKILRLGRTGAAAAPALTFSQRTAAVGAGLWRGSAIAARLARFGAPAVLAYMAIRHPSVINSLLVRAAEKWGLPAPAVQVAGWTLVLLPVIWLLRLLAAPIAWLLASLLRLIKPGMRLIVT